MLLKIQKWGSRQGFHLSTNILQKAGIHFGDEVIISVQDGRIVIEPVSKARNQFNIHELVARMPADYQVEEVS